MHANKEDNGSVEEVVSKLCNEARKEYEMVLNLSINKVKEVFSLALYKVSSLPPAPVASRVEDMPIYFRTDYLDAIDEANAAVNALRLITKDNTETDFNESAIASTETSEDVELMNTGKRMKYDRLKVVCDSYGKARQILIGEMEKYKKQMENIMTDASSNNDEVLFNVRGELVAASRVSLVNVATNRTYFDGLLDSGAWKKDAIGMCAIL
jgi:hypothetical protein